MGDEGDAGLLGGPDGRAVDGDLVGSGYDLLAEGGDLSVDPDFAIGDGGFGGAAGADSGVGEEFLQANGFVGHEKTMEGNPTAKQALALADRVEFAGRWARGRGAGSKICRSFAVAMWVRRFLSMRT